MSLRDAACGYVVDRGWAVLPLMPRSKLPNGILVPHGFKEATKDAGKVLYWWREEPQGNIGIACRESGLLVVDIDDDDAIEGSVLPDTLSAWTGRGEHLYYLDPGVPVKGKLCDGIDIKSNGYVLAPPSVHPNGQRYEWCSETQTASPAPPNVIRQGKTRNTSPRNELAGERPTGPLDEILAEQFISALTGREVIDGWAQCPFHAGGKERTPSLYCEGKLWCCYACEPMEGQENLGGDIYTFAALLWGPYPMPLRGADFAEVEAQLKKTFNEPR